MNNLLYAINIFGLDLDWNTNETIIICLLVQILLIIITVIVFGVLIWRTRGKNQEQSAAPLQLVMKSDRTLVGISLDLESVKTDFKAGETFDCTGLAIKAFYNLEPCKQTVDDYAVIDSNQLKELEEKKETPFCYVLIPDMNTEGETDVRVVCGAHSESYTISINAQEEAPVCEECTEANVDDTEANVDEQVEEEVKKVEEVIEETAEEVAQPVRTLTGITLNTDSVKKEYFVGEKFDDYGLVVTAHYDSEPYEEEVKDYSINAPFIDLAGEAIVTVSYCDMYADYTITVEQNEEEPVIPVYDEDEADAVENTEPEQIEEQVEEQAEQEIAVTQVLEPTDEEYDDDQVMYDKFRKRFNRSFTARLIQSTDEIKDWYGELKNCLLSYKKVKSRMSWKRETYKRGRDMIAKMSFRGKTLCLFLPLNPNDYVDTKYKVEDASENATYADTPCMYRIKNERRVKYAMELIAEVMARLGIEMTNREPENYYLPYENTRALIDKELIKVISEDLPPVFETPVATVEQASTVEGVQEEVQEEEVLIDEEQEQLPPQVGDEEEVDEEDEEEDSELPAQRAVPEDDAEYDRSFKAMLIQSRYITKALYSDLKNEFMSYKDVRAYSSWDYESYKVDGKNFAKFGFVGKTLVVYLPLDTADYADCQFEIEDKGDDKMCAETPFMLYLKNYDQYRFALEVIRKAKDKCGLEKGEHKSKNYYVYRQSTAQLLEQGLIKKIEPKAE